MELNFLILFKALLGKNFSRTYLMGTPLSALALCVTGILERHMTIPNSKPFFKLIDCVQIPVPNLSDGIRFYGQCLGHRLIWRTREAAGFRLPNSDSELVIYTKNRGVEIDWKVDSVDAAVQRWRESGGKVVVNPFDIKIGRCAVLHDPWGNELVILDNSKGVLKTDSEGNVMGLESQD